MPKTSTRRKGKTNQAAGTRKTKVNANGKHCETCEEAAMCSAQDLRENVPFTNASSWVSTFAIYVFEEGDVWVTNSTTNRFIELFYKHFA